ncbi:MAG: sugar phosphate isomerase/epimerase [Sedimentisphaerales bacterium]|nr:sugar phosphate isomerase/epimerase [Sedimentisphaerales bacterium]
MKIGFNVLLWTPAVEEEHFGLFETLKKTGYDGAELPIFGGQAAHYRKVGRALEDAGLACTGCTVIPDEQHNPISPEAQCRQGGLDYLRQVIDCCAAAGAEVLCGPFYQPLGQFTGQAPSEQEKKWAAEVIRQAADHADEAGITLALESLNRFECYFLNTLADGAAFVKRVDHPRVGMMYDTFHGNIEEKDPVGCVSENIDVIRHVHVSENDRGTPGRGHVPFRRIFKALRAGGYDQWLTIEAFGRSLPDLAATTCVWRDLSGSDDEVYQEGFKMIRQEWAAAR